MEGLMDILNDPKKLQAIGTLMKLLKDSGGLKIDLNLYVNGEIVEEVKDLMKVIKT